MSKKESAPATEQEFESLEDFQLEMPKVVKKINPEELKKRAEKVNSDGTVGLSNFDSKVINDLDNTASELADQLFTASQHSEDFKEITSILSSLGDEDIRKSSKLSSDMLSRGSIRDMISTEKSSGTSTTVARDLSNLRSKIVDLDPRRKKSLARNKLFGIPLPFNIGKKVDDIIQDNKDPKSALEEIVRSLNNGKDQLLLNNAHIDNDREEMSEVMKKLEQYIYIIKQLDAKIEDRLPEIEAKDKLKADDIRQEILFPIRQKSMDIVQHYAVCMQGYMALQVLKKNNVELIRGVDRASNTTVAALQIAMTVAVSLEDQRVVSKILGEVNDSTNGIIAQTSEQLLLQGTEIQKQATESAISADVIGKALDNIVQAMDQVDNFRAAALPKMKETVEALESSVANVKQYISEDRKKRIGNLAEELSEPAGTKLNENGAVEIKRKISQGRKPRTTPSPKP